MISLTEYADMLVSNPSFCHVLATPLLDLSSISLPRSLLDYPKNHFTLKVYNSDWEDILLFDSDECSTEVWSLDDKFLTIRLEQSKLNRPLWFSTPLFLRVTADYNRFVISDEIYDLKFGRGFVYDKEQDLQISSRDMIEPECFVSCTYFRHATIASVTCSFCKIDDDCGLEEDKVVVSGSISSRVKPLDVIVSRLLFDKQYATLDLHKLCWTSNLAVPAYSCLEIIVSDMIVGQERFGGHNFNFEPYYDGSQTVEKVGLKWRFLVTVNWEHAYFSLPSLCECYIPGEEALDLSEFDESESGQSSAEFEATLHKRPKRSPIEVKPVLDIVERFCPLPSLRLSPLHLVEVFSITACPCVGNLDSGFCISGNITCKDYFGDHVAFNESRNNGSLLYPHQPIPLTKLPRCHTGSGFAMRLDLDDDLGRQLCRGYLAWDYGGASLWWDRRLCSIVRGKDGFAAVHYTMFANAVQAVVSVSYVAKEGLDCEIHGSIKGKYTGYRYETIYDKLYYQSILFERSEKEDVSLYAGCSIPLSKAVVAVPLDEALVVIADLTLRVGDKEERLKGMVKVDAQEAGTEPVSKFLFNKDEDKYYPFSVSVSWG